MVGGSRYIPYIIDYLLLAGYKHGPSGRTWQHFHRRPTCHAACPRDPRTPKAMPLTAFGTRVLKYWVLGPSGCSTPAMSCLPEPWLQSQARPQGLRWQSARRELRFLSSTRHQISTSISDTSRTVCMRITHILSWATSNALPQAVSMYDPELPNFV